MKGSFAKIYVYDSGQLNNNSLYQLIYKSVNNERKIKVDRLSDRKERNNSLAAEYLLQKACVDFGISYKNQKIVFNDYGKPAFGNCPFRFNLSHSEDRAICAVSLDEVGCDVEKMEKVDFELVSKHFHRKEKQWIESQETREDKLRTFYRIWTLKESYVKCLGSGLNEPSDSYVFEMVNSKIRLIDDISTGNYSFKEFFLNDGYIYSCCVKTNSKNLLEDMKLQIVC